ncbi:MAG: hypothetical protein ACKOBW_08775 [Planctomycetota bacterium]
MQFRLPTNQVAACLIGLSAVFMTVPSWGQRVAMPSPPPTTAGPGMVPVAPPGTAPSGIPANAVPYGPGPYSYPPVGSAPGMMPPSGAPPGYTYPAPSGATLGAPTFDPYSSTVPATPSSSFGAPVYSGNPTAPSLFGSAPAAPSPYGTSPYGTAPYGASPYGAPPAGTAPFGSTAPPTTPFGTSPFGTAPPSTTPYGANPYGTAPYGSATAPTGGSPWNTMPPPGGYPTYPNYNAPTGPPSALFPNGFGGSAGKPPLRLIDNWRLQDSWVNGSNDPLDVGIHDILFATTLQYPNFFGSGSPLTATPYFILSLWDGPGVGTPPRDLPGSAYAALVDVGWKSNQQNLAGVDLSVALGAYSDFETLTTDSLRVTSLSYGWIRLTPQIMLKLGVDYINRVDLKLLPAVGLLWEPTPDIKFDIFFPRPKLAFRMTQMQGADVWLYAAGEYGGGSWTIHHPGGNSDQVDINDIRVGAGLEWISSLGLKAHFEIAWVTSREVVYRYNPTADFSPPDSFMLRAGIAF